MVSVLRHVRGTQTCGCAQASFLRTGVAWPRRENDAPAGSNCVPLFGSARRTSGWGESLFERQKI